MWGWSQENSENMVRKWVICKHWRCSTRPRIRKDHWTSYNISWLTSVSYTLPQAHHFWNCIQVVWSLLACFSIFWWVGSCNGPPSLLSHWSACQLHTSLILGILRHFCIFLRISQIFWVLGGCRWSACAVHSSKRGSHGLCRYGLSLPSSASWFFKKLAWVKLFHFKLSLFIARHSG